MELHKYPQPGLLFPSHRYTHRTCHTNSIELQTTPCLRSLPFYHPSTAKHKTLHPLSPGPLSRVFGMPWQSPRMSSSGGGVSLMPTQKSSSTAKSASYSQYTLTKHSPAYWSNIRFLDTENFVNAIAPRGDLTKIDRVQFAMLFHVADASKRSLVSWEDFTVFETLLKRPDADYWIAFQYFDV